MEDTKTGNWAESTYKKFLSVRSEGTRQAKRNINYLVVDMSNRPG